MISILVPCFDYNAYPLVSLLEKQALMLKINFEIICIDDGSFSSKNELNQKINLLTNSRFIESKKNIGRVKNRLLLAEKSQYEFLLFIDVDTTPTDENFLKNYIAQLHKGRIIFGGCNYKNPENKNSSLRYKFGKEREEINFAVRNKNPYKYISSNNFICERDLLFDILPRIDNISYGNDYIFGSILKKIKIDILHIDNPVLVNNIDENSIFIKKTHQALENLIICYRSNKIEKHSISILKTYIILEFLFLKNIFIKTSNIFKNILEKNLTSEDPNLFLFDIYRLNYICKIK